MTVRQTARKDTASALIKTGLVQFRADEELMTNLTQVADRLHLPVGVLARLWVSERLYKEISFDLASIKAWRDERYTLIDQIIEEAFHPGPIKALHLIPFQRHIEIEPERVRQLQGMLTPVERVDEFTGRINLEGYQTTKQFKSEETIAGSVQVFRGGQIESIREIKRDEQNYVYADYIDDDLIRAVWSYSCALEALQVKPPISFFVGFKRMKGCRLTSQRFPSPSAEILCEGFQTEGITIKAWNDVLKIENAARTVKKILDRFANAAGLARSMSYSASGDWLGPIDRQDNYVRKSRMLARTEVIELSGINRNTKRLDLILHSAAADIIVGKVRAPYLEPSQTTHFKCLVNQDEMAPGAKELLYKHLKQAARFSLGKLQFSGCITRIVENNGAGSFDAIDNAEGSVLMFDVEPSLRAPLAAPR
jgi:hypothetical protein